MNSSSDAGIIVIRNTIKPFFFMMGSLDIGLGIETLKDQLNRGVCSHDALQKQWDLLGEAAFNFEVLEKIPRLSEGNELESQGHMEKLLQRWRSRLSGQGISVVVI